jgi:hypothetical protein
MSSMLQALKAQVAPVLPARPSRHSTVTSQWLTPPNALLDALAEADPDDHLDALDSMLPTLPPVSGEQGGEQ